MNGYIKDFENYLISERKASKNTVESYKRDISKFILFCEGEELKSISSAKSSFIKKYTQYMLSDGQSEASVSRTIASLRSYFKYLNSQGIVNASPMENITQIHTAKKLPEILTNKEVITLLHQPSGNDFKSSRDRAMLELLYATGIKVSELISLKLSDINLNVGILHLKAAKSERIIPIYPDAIKALSAYINAVRVFIVSDNENDFLFTNMNGQAMTRQGFWKIIKQYAAQAKIKKDITPHTLRHSFAAHLLENGAQLSDIKEMLGHSDISSTQIYAQIMKNKYASAYKKFHPMAR
ncbi:MAG: tyrosine recombinase [Clostridia bacterium]|nr:tyrosine recombinase [Clostridia bacterium]